MIGYIEPYKYNNMCKGVTKEYSSEGAQWLHIIAMFAYIAVLCSHDTNDVTRRELVATHSATNNVEEIVADLIGIILFKKLHLTLYKFDACI